MADLLLNLGEAFFVEKIVASVLDPDLAKELARPDLTGRPPTLVSLVERGVVYAETLTGVELVPAGQLSLLQLDQVASLMATMEVVLNGLSEGDAAYFGRCLLHYRCATVTEPTGMVRDAGPEQVAQYDEQAAGFAQRIIIAPNPVGGER